MADNTSAGAMTWRKRMLSAGLISDDDLSYSQILFPSHHDEYDVCETVCEASNGSSEFVSAAKVLGRRLTNAYISSPVYLALGPFIMGLFFGWLGCKIWTFFSNSETPNDRKQSKVEKKKSQGSTRKERVSVDKSDSTTLLPQIVSIASLFCSTFICIKIFLKGFVVRDDEQSRANRARKHLISASETMRESGVEIQNVPHHIAVIMDGNRRYGKARYGSISKGHWDGSKKLVEFSKWCLAEQIQIVTVYAFSTENWSRDANEISSLMKIFATYCDELREEAVKRGIRIKVLSTEDEKLPSDVQVGIRRMVDETAKGDKLLMNICLSYGSRGEIVNACRSISSDIQQEKLQLKDISEKEVGKRLLTGCTPDPDIVIRTSGEYRLSNFLLWQLAYSEMFFLNTSWPEITKLDLIRIIRSYANNRKRRFGK